MMKKTLFVLAALLTSACASEQVREPTVVYRGGYDGQGCDPYTGTCHYAQKKYIVENADGNIENYNYRPTTTVKQTGQYKHCSDVIFGDPVPAPKYVASGPKVVTQQTQPVQAQQVQYVRQVPLQYVQQPAVQYVQPTTITVPTASQPCNGCQPTVTQTREPIEVLFKRTTTKTVYEPKTTQDVAYEKEPYAGQITLPVQQMPAPVVMQAPTMMPAPVVMQAPTLTVPAPTSITVPLVSTQPTTTIAVRQTMPEARLVSEIAMDPDEVK